MGFNFPNTPTVGDLYPTPALPGVPQYRWDGAVWTTTTYDPLTWVQRAGDTMTGALNVVTPPTLPAHAASKAYVDAASVAAAPFASAMAYSGMQVNGGCEVSQELGSSPVTSTSNLKNVVDAWKISTSGPHTIRGQQQSVTVPPGFSNSIQFTATVANASPGVNDLAAIVHDIEGTRVARLGWGTANAMPITISFWVYSIAGTFSGSLRNGANNRSYTFTFTVNAANTWEYKSITIPGDTTGTWNKDNLTAISVCLMGLVGATYCTPANTWTAGMFLGVAGGVNVFKNTIDGILITGFTVLPGIYAPTAAQSPLIMRPYDQELQTCQRYYQKSFPYETPVGPNKGALGAIAYVIPVASAYGAAEAHYGTKMRASPAITCYNPAANVNNKWYNLGSAADSGTPTIAHNSADRCLLVNTHVAGDLANHSLVIHYVADARL